MVHFETYYYMITSITTITTNFHYYITTNYSITTMIRPPNLEMAVQRMVAKMRLRRQIRRILLRMKHWTSVR